MPRSGAGGLGPDRTGSPAEVKSARSCERMLRQLLDGGRFAALEELLDRARRGTGPVAVRAGQALAQLWRQEGDSTK